MEQESTEATIGDPDTAVITILDDDYPGVFTFEQENTEVMETIGTVSIKVIRLLGARSVVRIPYHTVECSAKGGGEDYEDVVGEIEFRDEETRYANFSSMLSLNKCSFRCLYPFQVK